MKVQVHVMVGVDARHEGRRPENDSRNLEVDVACPACARPAPILVFGTGVERNDHDTYYAAAITRCCGKNIGEIEAHVSTIFGINEDERVTGGPWRVY